MAKQSAEVAVKEQEEVELARLAEIEAQLAAQNQSEVDAADIQIPLLKVGQPLTQEVADGEARPGEFINALTREGLGTEVEFVVAGYQKGRFFHGDRNKGIRARKAYGTKIVPWNDDPFYGQPFSEHPDAEEKYSQRVNAGEIEWGKGPSISTTYDFTGHVVSGLAEGEEPIPVCLSLMRTNSKQAKKWITLLDAVLRGRYWDAVFTLTTSKGPGDQSYYVVNVKQTRKTTPEEKVRALGLAQVLRNQTVQVVGEDEAATGPTSAPEAQGGMAV